MCANFSEETTEITFNIACVVIHMTNYFTCISANIAVFIASIVIGVALDATYIIATITLSVALVVKLVVTGCRDNIGIGVTTLGANIGHFAISTAFGSLGDVACVRMGSDFARSITDIAVCVTCIIVCVFACGLTKLVIVFFSTSCALGPTITLFSTRRSLFFHSGIVVYTMVKRAAKQASAVIEGVFVGQGQFFFCQDSVANLATCLFIAGLDTGRFISINVRFAMCTCGFAKFIVLFFAALRALGPAIAGFHAGRSLFSDGFESMLAFLVLTTQQTLSIVVSMLLRERQLYIRHYHVANLTTGFFITLFNAGGFVSINVGVAMNTGSFAELVVLFISALGALSPTIASFDTVGSLLSDCYVIMLALL
jgi:hypothetical protein